MWPKKLIWQLFISYLLIMGVPVAIATWYSSLSFKKFYMTRTKEELKSRALLIGSHIEDCLNRSSANCLDSLCKSFAKKVKTRFTIIAPTGKVLGDSEKNPDSMESHLNRAEVAAAVSGEVGVSIRFSRTLGTNMVYTALPVYVSGKLCTVVRAAIPIASFKTELSDLFMKNIFAVFFMACLAALVSYLISRKISTPINAMTSGAMRFASGDFTKTLPLSGYQETRHLAVALNEMARKLSGMITRITEQNHELDAILSSMTEGVIAIDETMRIILVNNAAAELFAIDSRYAAGKLIREVLHNDEVREFLVKALQAEKTIEQEVPLPTPFSEVLNAPRFLQLQGSSLHDPSSNKIGALMVISDITQLKKLESIRQDFVANVSHEMRTPLTSIKGFVETLAAGAVDDPVEARRFLGILSKQADRITMIVNDLLSLSRIERDAEQKAIELAEGSIAEVLGSSIETCSARAHLKNITIECSCDPGVTAMIERTLLEQAVVNLVDNAINYSGNDSRILVKAFYARGGKDDAHREVVISVKDDGVGIAQEHLSRLFERFYRVDKARSRKMGGTGLGLSIVNHIALAHGGRVGVESSPGKGSTFYIYLPKT